MMLAAAGLFGALLGLLLALALLTQRRGPVFANRRLGWLLLASAAAAGSIAGSHLLAGGRTLLLLVELVVALAVGPLLLAYVRAALRPPDEPAGRLWPRAARRARRRAAGVPRRRLTARTAPAAVAAIGTPLPSARWSDQGGVLRANGLGQLRRERSQERSAGS